jgi:hypothetical protein
MRGSRGFLQMWNRAVKATLGFGDGVVIVKPALRACSIKRSVFTRRFRLPFHNAL